MTLAREPVTKPGMRLLAWLPLAVFLAHVAEELPRFPAWATRHFGATSRAWYVYSHIVLISALAAVCAAGRDAAPGSPAMFLVTGAMLTLAINGLFHAATTLLFREYSPGVVTALLLFFPATALLVTRVSARACLSNRELLLSLIAAASVQGLVIGSLFLKMDFDWKLRRPRAE